MKKIPLRRCIVTREQLPKQELLRIVRDKEGKVSVDQTGKLGGRGAYIKMDIEGAEEDVILKGKEWIRYVKILIV